MNQDYSEQEGEEGFAASQIIIEKKQQTINKSENAQNSQFQAKAITTELHLKLQPTQLYQIKQQCNIHPTQTQLKNNKHSKKNNKPYYKMSPYQSYYQNNQYVLVYSRVGQQQPIQDNQQYINNFISLKDVCNKSGQYLRKLRQIDSSEQNFSSDRLIFDSKFQGGNLHCAYRLINTDEYYLMMQNDTNSRGYTQWFYYSIRNTNKNKSYTFHITNFKKKYSFVDAGYQPVAFSLKNSQQNQCHWYRTGFNISYQQNNLTTNHQQNDKFYTLTFSITTPYHNDYFMIAFSLPYSYSRLLYQLKQHQTIVKKNPNIIWSSQSICQTLSGNNFLELTITSIHNNQKNMLIFLGRAHPSQTWSSFMIQGILSAIVKNGQQIQQLLNNFTLKIYPMINIDGVIYGNSRCDISGVDMNRRWTNPSPVLHPQIYQMKKKIKQYSKQYNIQCCYDFHGHSKKYGIFSYSCKNNPQSCRILPFMLQNENQFFKFSSCTFGVSRWKKSTARAVISKIIDSQNVHTIQTSLYGAKSDNVIKIFEPYHIYKMAKDILITTKHFLNNQSTKLQQARIQVQSNIKQLINYQNKEQSGSDSDPSADEIDFEEKLNKILPSNFKNQIKFFKKGISYRNEKKKKLSQHSHRIENQEQKSRILLHSIQPKKEQNNFSGKNKFKNKMYKSPHQNPNKTIDHQYKFISKPAPKRQAKIIINKKYQIKSKLEERLSNNKSKQQPSNISETMEYEAQTQQKNNKLTKLYPKAYLHKPSLNFIRFEQNYTNYNQLFRINLLNQVKNKIQLEKLKKNVELSTSLVEKQGKIRTYSKKKQQIIDFKQFKNNAKAKAQIKKKYQINSRYIGPGSNYQT